MIITDDMLAAAFCYRETNLWYLLCDHDVFAFRLSDGETGYCCVMGNAGEHLALGFYRGEERFATYLKTITMTEMRLSDLDMFEMAMTFDCINCDFMNAADLEEKGKKVVRRYADANGVKIRRPHGWPDFIRHQPYKVQYAITNKDDARDITEALNAAIAVARMVKISDWKTLGFDEEGRYPTIEGGKSVPYLIPTDGGMYEWSTTKLPALKKREYVAPKFDNDILSRKMKGLPVSGALQMRLIHVPAPTGSAAAEVPFFPALMLCVNEESGHLFPFLCAEDVETNPVTLLVDIANTFCKGNSKPKTIYVEDAKTEALLKDFCHRCGIALTKKRKLASLDEAWGALISNLMMQ